MQIEKKQNGGTPSVAHAYAAIFPTRLALARWTHGGDLPHIQPARLSAQDAPARAGWYDQAQGAFQTWLEAGGFHQPELDGLDSAVGGCLASK